MCVAIYKYLYNIKSRWLLGLQRLVNTKPAGWAAGVETQENQGSVEVQWQFAVEP